MKKYMTKSLALLLALVMVLGVVPFAAAMEAEITCNKDAVWPGQTVSLALNLPEGTGVNGVTWSGGITGTSNAVSYTVPGDAEGSVTISATASTEATPSNPEGESVSASITLPVLTPADESFSVSGPSTAVVGEPVSFSYSGANDSDVTWTVEGPAATISSAGKFKATEAGEYTVTATAKNGGSIAAVKDSATITVTAAAYTVTMGDKNVPLTASSARMSFTVKSTADGSTPNNYTARFSSSDSSVAEIDNEGFLTLKKKGSTTITVTVTVDGIEYYDDAELTVTNDGTITCAQDGTETASDSITMVFKLNAAGADEDVQWDVKVSGEGEFETSDLSENGNTASITIECEDIGIARVNVSAQWGSDGNASELFCVSFYETVSVKAYVKDGVEKFNFDKTGVFDKVSNTSNPEKRSLYSFLTDGVATNVTLSENSSYNERVGKITAANASGFYQYDPDDDNDYVIADLEDLSFKVLGTGTYKLEYELYGMVGYKGYATTKGTIQIICGDAAGTDIEYTTTAGSSIEFRESDFEDFWKENGEKSEDLKYVTFDVATITNMKGRLYTGDDLIKSTWKFYPDNKNSTGSYDLSKVTYRASDVSGSYEDTVNFICYGDDGSKVSGAVTITVNDGKMSFSDVTASDWFYDEVFYVWVNGVMNGTDTKKFSPNDTLTRGMVVTMLWRIDGEPAMSTAGSFTDVTEGQWYTQAVEWASKNDIVNGMGNGKFAPDRPITREQLAAILYRYAKYRGDNVSKSANLQSYEDASSVSDYAVTALQWACGSGIITGDGGKLMPQGSATRAQAAAMFARFMQLDPGKSSTDRDDDEDEDDEDKKIVYITPTGTRYHYDEECAGKNAIEKELRKVEDDYKPCGTCVK